MATRSDAEVTPPALSAVSAARAARWRGGISPLALERLVLLGPPLLFLAFFMLVPLSAVVVTSFWKPSFAVIERTWTLENYAKLATTPVYPSLLLKTLRIALGVTLITILLGYPMAYFLSRRGGRRKRLLFLLVLIPFWSSYLLRTFSWLPVLGLQGVLNNALVWLGILREPSPLFLYNEFSLHLAFVHLFLPFMIIPIFVVLETLDRALLEAAADLGANKWQTFWRVTVPLTLPGVLGGSVLVFMNTLASYVTPKLVGGTSGIMYASAIADRFAGIVNVPLGAALTAVLLLVLLLVAAVAGLVGRYQARARAVAPGAAPAPAIWEPGASATQ